MPVTRVLPSDTLSLVSLSEEVNTGDWGTSVEFTLPIEDVSGEILGITLVGRRDSATGDTGVIPIPAGKLVVFDADPSISAGDTFLTSGIHQTIIGEVPVVAGDYTAFGRGSVAFFDNPLPFYGLKNLYFAWFHEDATDINDATGDNEVFELTIRFRIEDR